MFRMGKIQRKQNVSNIWPLFGHFWENSATDFCTAAYKFTRPKIRPPSKKFGPVEA